MGNQRSAERKLEQMMAAGAIVAWENYWDEADKVTRFAITTLRGDVLRYRHQNVKALYIGWMIGKGEKCQGST
jgi:hypothetical protein